MRLKKSGHLLLLLWVLSAASVLSAPLATDEGRGDSLSPDHQLLSRQRRNPLLVRAAIAIVRVGGRFAIRQGAKIVRFFKTEREASKYMQEPEMLRKISNLPADKENIVSVPSATVAKEIAKKLSPGKMKPQHDPNPKVGDPHFHPVDSSGNRMPQHISYPKPPPILPVLPILPILPSKNGPDAQVPKPPPILPSKNGPGAQANLQPKPANPSGGGGSKSGGSGIFNRGGSGSGGSIFGDGRSSSGGSRSGGSIFGDGPSSSGGSRSGGSIFGGGGRGG